MQKNEEKAEKRLIFLCKTAIIDMNTYVHILFLYSVDARRFDAHESIPLTPR